jgi:hypothetical protein
LFGERARKDSGQLALLDATVFFAAAILLSSIVISFSFGPSGETGAGGTRIDANEILVALLHASVAERFEIVLDEPLMVTGSETFALCLSLEASMVMAGGSTEPFQAMNDVIRDALLMLSPAGFLPCLAVTEKDRGLQDPLFAIPEMLPRGAEVHSGSAWIPSSTGEELLVVLMLVPALSAELASV